MVPVMADDVWIREDEIFAAAAELRTAAAFDTPRALSTLDVGHSGANEVLAGVASLVLAVRRSVSDEMIAIADALTYIGLRAVDADRINVEESPQVVTGTTVAPATSTGVSPDFTSAPIDTPNPPSATTTMTTTTTTTAPTP